MELRKEGHPSNIVYASLPGWWCVFVRVGEKKVQKKTRTNADTHSLHDDAERRKPGR